MIPVALLVAAVAWVGVRGLLAKGELEEAQALIREMKQSALDFDLPAVGTTFNEVKQHSEAARGLTSDPVWRLFEFIPWAGGNLTVVREVAATAADTVVALEPLADLASSLDPAALAPVDGAIPIEPFEKAVPIVQAASARISELTIEVGEIDASSAIGPVADARKRVADLLESTAPALETASSLLPLVPPLLGSEGVKTYVVMFQNNAEARSLGGTALSFAQITIDHGHLSLIQTVPAGYGNFPYFDSSPIPTPDGVDEVYPGSFGRFIVQATLRPSFPSAAEITSATWSIARGVHADGVISLDAVALSYVLRATGPIPLSTGDVLDADNVVRLLLNEVLQRYNSGDIEADNVAQDAVYSEAVAQTFSKLSGGQFDVAALMRSVAQGFTEQRFSYWSATPADQATIAAAGLVNDVPQSDDETDRVGLYVNDSLGAKLDFYLRTALVTASAVCTDDGRQVHRLSYTLQNELDPASVGSLSPLIAGVNYVQKGIGRGDQLTTIFVYAPPGSTFLGATVDGAPVVLQPLHDTDHPVARIMVLAHPGGSTAVSLDIAMGSPGDRALEVETTPGVYPTAVATGALDCSTVPAVP
ncbi:MAG: DUF4012 domain-containing protein [Pseudolysinimonas sp.]